MKNELRICVHDDFALQFAAAVEAFKKNSQNETKRYKSEVKEKIWARYLSRMHHDNNNNVIEYIVEQVIDAKEFRTNKRAEIFKSQHKRKNDV